jgi:hypothetical protein
MTTPDPRAKILRDMALHADCDATAAELAERAEQAEADLATAREDAQRLRAALELAMSALPDSIDKYQWAWDECTSEEQEWVKSIRSQIAALLTPEPQQEPPDEIR